MLFHQVRAQPAGGAAAEAEASCPVTQDKSGAVTITVHAKPGSKHSSITGDLHTVYQNRAAPGLSHL